MKARRVMIIGLDGMQLCQVRRFAGEGALPNFARLLQRGSAGQLLPELPAWTPTNWGTIATGALPGSTMLTGWHRRSDDDLDGEWDLSTFSSRACPVETLWQCAERAGLKTLTIFYPLTWPPTTETGLVVAPLYSGPGTIPLDIAKEGIWSTRPEAFESAEPITVRREDGRLMAEVAVAPSAVGLAREFNFGDKPADAREQVQPGDPVPLTIAFDPASQSARICRADGRPLAEAGRGEWTEWVTLDFGARGEGAIRFYLFSCDGSAEHGLALCRSSIYPTRGFTHPGDLSADLVEHVGPFLASPIHPPGDEGTAVYLGEYAYQGLWMARAARRLLETRGWDLLMLHYHVLDSATHRWLNRADPAGGGYRADRAPHYVDLLRRAYQAADAMLGEFMAIADDETALLVVSDHGNVPNQWLIDRNRLFEQAGFLVRDGAGNIVWERTRAFMVPQRICHVYVNLKGRFPKGIVDPADCERTQDEIIDALMDFRNPAGGRVVAYAIKKRDAEIVGSYGPECGDVVFVYNAGHGHWTFPPGEVIRRDDSESNHGPQIATTRTGFSSNLAAAIIMGPGIRRGYVRNDRADGLWRLIDIAPTVSHLLGFNPPAASRGGVMYDVFE